MSGPFDLGDPPGDPVRRAQVHAKPELPKRFYKEATVGEVPEGFVALLDGRVARTPSSAPAAVPLQSLGAALAAEWNAQGTHINPATMPLSRLVNTTIDGVVAAADRVAEEIVAYSGTDLLCYRPDGPEGLLARIARAWDPVVAWAEQRFGVRLVLAEGLMPVAQDTRLAEAVRGAIPRTPALALAATHVLTTLTGSALIALAVAEGALGFEDAWTAAHVDEDWTIDLWGADAEAAARRAARRLDAAAAARAISEMRAAGMLEGDTE